MSGGDIITDIQIAVQKFYSQFSAAFPEALEVPSSAEVPYITYDFKSGDLFTSSLMTFQIWDKANNMIKLNEIADKIEKAIPVMIGTQIPVIRDAKYEWHDIKNDNWIEFKLSEFSQVARLFCESYPDGSFEWRESGGKKAGVLRLFRGAPFIQPIPINPAEREIVRYLGNIEIKNYVI